MPKIRRYDETAEVYHRRYQHIQRVKYQAITPFLVEGPLIDVGIGTGIGLPVLREFTPIIGVDGSHQMLQFAKQQITENNQWQTRICLVCAAVDMLPFRRQVFPTVLSITVLQNLDDINQGYQELLRVSRLGGVLAITVLGKVISLTQLESIMNKTGIPIATFEALANEDVGMILKRQPI